MNVMKTKTIYLLLLIFLFPLYWAIGSLFYAIFQSEVFLKTLVNFDPVLIFMKIGYWILAAFICMAVLFLAGINKNKTYKLLQIKKSEMAALLKATRAVLECREFKSTAMQIFDTCKTIIGAKSGYISLLSVDGTHNEYLFLDQDGSLQVAGTDLEIPVQGILSQAYKTCKPMYQNDCKKNKWVKFMPDGYLDTRNVLFVPLVNNSKVVGLLVLTEKDKGFNDEDTQLAIAFGEIASIALYNSRNSEMFEESEKQKIDIIYKLNEVIAKIKTLSGLLPICASCKKIRGSKGYWYQVEEYIEKHSDAEFSHGLCPDCIKKLYPNMFYELFSDTSSGKEG